jgi:putative ATP-binding cassette transporter
LLAVPMMDMVNVAAAHLRELKLQMGNRAPDEEPARIPDFQTIEMRDLHFAYPPSKKEAGFAVGPIDVTIRRGEILFITGANGFGKSTILKMIAGLFPITAGTILVDGEPVTDMARYRSMFAGVFTDYHLFRKLYGVTASDEEAKAVLSKLEVQAKVDVRHGTFSTVQLSSGQRKRLALAVALLEQRPILVLDEWAAEQDPFFRKTFYEEVLPWIRERGQTVVAVTHDDRYFGAADRTLMVEDGRLHEGRP